MAGGAQQAESCISPRDAVTKNSDRNPPCGSFASWRLEGAVAGCHRGQCGHEHFRPAAHLVDAALTLVYRTGDLFSSTCPALGHGVNTLGRMGAGIAVEFRRRWPAMYDAYVEACRSGRLRPGGIFVYQAPDRLIVNMATQRGIGRGSARLEWVREAARLAGQLELESLALPRIAAGLGGLAWEDVADVLEAELALVPYVEVWALP